MTRIRPDGGITGTYVSPTLSSAGGIWTLKDIERNTRTNTWPLYYGNNDTYFPYTTLLIHGDGTNGANNSYFVDSSASSYIPFSNTASYFFSGSSYLTFTTPSTSFGTADFTIDCFVYPTAAYGSLSRMFFYGPSTQTGYLTFYINTSGNIIYGPSGTALITTSGTVPLNAWTHIAISRVSGTTTIYINGSSSGSASDGTNYPGATTLYLGTDAASHYFTGYISNFRLIKGSGIYSGSTITVPTTQLTSVTNTFLLTAQSPALIDNGPSAFSLTNTGSVASTIGGNPITRSGSTTQGTFSPFSTTGWSNYFNGSTDYLIAGSSISLSGDFTIECWVYGISYGSNGFYLYGLGNDLNATAATFFISTTGYLRIYTGNANKLSGTTTAISLNKWNHIAFVRSSGTINAYLNGVLVDSAASWTNALSGTSYVSAELNGVANNIYVGGSCYISNLRVLNGTVLYTGNFNPSLTSLTQVANTQLLTCANNQFIGSNTTSSVPITITGTPQVQPFSPFNAAVYSNTGVGGSMYFNGSTDYLTTSSAGFNLTGNWTYETWFYATSTSIQVLFDSRGTGQQGYYVECAILSGTQISFFYNSSDHAISVSGITGQWNHIAVVKNGTNINVYWNGASVYNITDSNTWINGPNRPTIATNGYNNSVNYFQGYISNFRLVNGTALYTGNFTLPTAPFSPVSNTTFLLNATNASIIDSSQKNELITYGSAAISTTQSKFGGSSMYFNGSTSYITIPYSQVHNFGSGNFTVEGYFYASAFSATQSIIEKRTSGGFATGDWGLYISTSGTVIFYGYDYNSAGNAVLTSGTVSASTWYHFALVRNSTTITLYINGVSAASTTAVTIGTNSNGLTIGADVGSGTRWYMNGYLDELRITSGIARYTANFAPSSVAFFNN